MSNIFNNVAPASPGRSKFDLSYEKKLTCDMAELIPILHDEMYPGDTFQIGNEIVVRFQPMLAPILHEVNVYVHYFFVPYRLLWDDFEDFYTGGPDGDFTAPIPEWQPTDTTIGSLWDYIGFPTDTDPAGAYPIDFPRSAYNLIYNEWYRDETLIDEVALDNESILYRAWEKDFFTSALPWQQRGSTVALPVEVNSAPAVGGVSPSGTGVGLEGSTSLLQAGTNGVNNPELIEALNKLQVASFDVSELRTAFQIQKWQERNARAGSRFTEFLRSHYKVSPTDARLDRPEYCGGSKSPVIISEVLQTSASSSDVFESDTPQGNMAGHGITANRTMAASYKAEEPGIMMGIMSVMPRSAYQQGIDRQWLRKSNLDFFFPEFVNLSEQAVEQAEIFTSDVEAENRTLFGYQQRYGEMRVKKSLTCGMMRSSAPISFDYWHLARDFASAPLLNQEFIECHPSKRIFAVQDTEDSLIINVANIITATRPLPFIGEPGLIDHH